MSRIVTPPPKASVLSALLFSKSFWWQRSQTGEAFQPHVRSNYYSWQFETAKTFHTIVLKTYSYSKLSCSVLRWWRTQLEILQTVLYCEDKNIQPMLFKWNQYCVKSQSHNILIVDPGRKANFFLTTLQWMIFLGVLNNLKGHFFLKLIILLRKIRWKSTFLFLLSGKFLSHVSLTLWFLFSGAYLMLFLFIPAGQ